MKFCPGCGARVKQTTVGQPGNCGRCGVKLSNTLVSRRVGLADNFPFDTMRPSQSEVLSQVESALAESKKFIILEAPVGFGKSAIAAALCNHLGSAYLLTSTKQLQDQYSADFGFPIVTGKANFTCLVPTSSGKHLPCSKGRCEVDWKLSECPHYLTFEDYDQHQRGACGRDSKCRSLKDGKLCTYYEQKWDAFRAPIVVANYPFFLTELKHTDDIKHRRILVCDEAHDLEKQMVGASSFTLRRSLVEGFRSDNRSGESGNLHDRRQPFFIPDLGVEAASDWRAPLNEAKRVLEMFLDRNLDDESLQDRIASCKDTLDSLDAFISELDSSPENWVVNSLEKTAMVEGGGFLVDEVAFQPLDVSAYTSALFDSADTILLMSATVFSKELFCKTLGIVEEEASFIRVRESSFPIGNRIIHALNTAQLNRNTMEASLAAVTKAVDDIMTLHSGERGVIHTTSYQQARYIREHVSERNRTRISSTEGIASRSALIRAHGSRDESVLISPSLYQGVDLKDDLSRFQILVKVPYADLSERRTRVKLERERAWYDWQTALRLVQTYGRSVRSETDYAVTYVLDSNFTRFMSEHRSLFPEYFLEAVKTTNDTVT